MLRFGASKGFLCRKIKYHLMKNREEDWKETVKKRQNKMEAFLSFNRRTIMPATAGVLSQTTV